jgi:hypothetical protein
MVCALKLLYVFFLMVSLGGRFFVWIFSLRSLTLVCVKKYVNVGNSRFRLHLTFLLIKIPKDLQFFAKVGKRMDSRNLERASIYLATIGRCGGFCFCVGGWGVSSFDFEKSVLLVVE